MCVVVDVEGELWCVVDVYCFVGGDVECEYVVGFVGVGGWVGDLVDCGGCGVDVDG